MGEHGLVDAFLEAHHRPEHDGVRVALDHLFDGDSRRPRPRRRGSARRSRASSSARLRSGGTPWTPPRPLNRCAMSSCRAASRFAEKARDLRRRRPASRTCAIGRRRASGASATATPAPTTVQPTRSSPVARCDDRDARGERPHRPAEGGAVGVMQAPLAQPRAPRRTSPRRRTASKARHRVTVVSQLDCRQLRRRPARSQAGETGLRRARSPRRAGRSRAHGRGSCGDS